MDIKFLNPSVAMWDDTNELPEKQVILFNDKTRIRMRFHGMTFQSLSNLETSVSGTTLHLTTNNTDPGGADFPLTAQNCTFATGNDQNGLAYSDIRVEMTRDQIKQLGLLPQQENAGPASKAWYDTGANDNTSFSNLSDSEAFAASNPDKLMGHASFYGHLDTPPPPPQPGGPNLPIDSGSSSKTFMRAAGGEVIQATYIGVSS